MPLQDDRGNIFGYRDPVDGSIIGWDMSSYGDIFHPRGSAAGGAITSDNLRLRHRSKWHDEVGGLIYYGKRFYHPKLGRFINRDPIQEAGGRNLYAMTVSDTVNSWDLLGMNDGLSFQPARGPLGLRQVLHRGYDDAPICLPEMEVIGYGLSRAEELRYQDGLRRTLESLTRGFGVDNRPSSLDSLDDILDNACDSLRTQLQAAKLGMAVAATQIKQIAASLPDGSAMSVASALYGFSSGQSLGRAGDVSGETGSSLSVIRAGDSKVNAARSDGSVRMWANESSRLADGLRRGGAAVGALGGALSIVEGIAGAQNRGQLDISTAGSIGMGATNVGIGAYTSITGRAVSPGIGTLAGVGAMVIELGVIPLVKSYAEPAMALAAVKALAGANRLLDSSAAAYKDASTKMDRLGCK